jgi:hypothetical protein
MSFIAPLHIDEERALRDFEDAVSMLREAFRLRSHGVKMAAIDAAMRDIHSAREQLDQQIENTRHGA